MKCCIDFKMSKKDVWLLLKMMCGLKSGKMVSYKCLRKVGILGFKKG